MPKPNFMIIGAQKSASSFVHTCLREHPDVFMPVNETPFFETPYYDNNEIDQFYALFNSVKTEHAIGIKRPDYLTRPECPARIYQHLPQAKLILVLRNPIERAISAYYWYMKQGYIPIKDVETGLTNILDGVYQVQYPKSQEIIDYGFYYKGIMRYLKYFNQDQLFITQHNQFREDARLAISNIYQFLDIDDTYSPKGLSKQPKRTIYNLTRLTLLAYRNRFTLTYHYTPECQVITSMPRQGLVWFAINILLTAIDRALLAPVLGNEKPSLSARLQEQLCVLYEQDLYCLENLLGYIP